ncbi:hypothetical protein B0O99DRAFT_600657 [Bisporella sp. PMI_857]|nr:hypothetical protein B0O99DRAFT_600657 [Bisporella sp. PMI_857]
MAPNQGAPDMESLATPTVHRQSAIPWREYEHRACVDVITEIRKEKNRENDAKEVQLQNQDLWDRVSHDLRARGIFRTPFACRNYWTTIGQIKSRFDDHLNLERDLLSASSSKTKRSARRKAIKEHDSTVSTACSSSEALSSVGSTSRETREADATYRWKSTAEQEEMSDGSIGGTIIHDGDANDTLEKIDGMEEDQDVIRKPKTAQGNGPAMTSTLLTAKQYMANSRSTSGSPPSQKTTYSSSLNIVEELKQSPAKSMDYKRPASLEQSDATLGASAPISPRQAKYPQSLDGVSSMTVREGLKHNPIRVMSSAQAALSEKTSAYLGASMPAKAMSENTLAKVIGIESEDEEKDKLVPEILAKTDSCYSKTTSDSPAVTLQHTVNTGASQNMAVELEEDIATSRLPAAESLDLKARKRKLTRVQYYPKKKTAPPGTRRKAVRFEEDAAASRDVQADANVSVTRTHDLRRSTRGVLKPQNKDEIIEEISLRQSTRLRALTQVKYFESDPEEEAINGEAEDDCARNVKRPTTMGKKEDPFKERKYEYPKFWFHRRDGHGDRELRILQDAEYGQKHPNKNGANWWMLAFAKDPARACKIFNDQLQLPPEQKDWSYNWDEIANSWDQTRFKERVTLHFDVNHLGEPLRAWANLWQEDEKEPTRVKLGLVNKYFVYSLRYGVHSLPPPLPSKWPVIQTGKKSGGPILKLTGIDGNTLDNLYRWKKIDDIIVTVPQGEECPEEVASRWFNVEYLAELDNKRRRRKVFCRCVATVRPDSPWERMVKCKRCGTRQHLECYGYDPDGPPPKRYRCEWCKKDAEIEATVDTIISKLRSCSNEQLQAIKRGKEVGFNPSPEAILNSAVDLPPISIHWQKSGCHLSLL